VIILVGAVLFAYDARGSAGYHLWLLDEGRGAVAVDSGTVGVDMEIAEAVWVEDGPFPDTRALRFDGSGRTYAHFAGRISSDQGTIEMWMRPRRLEGSQVLFSTKFGSTSRLRFHLRDGDLACTDYWWQDNNTISAPGAFAAGDIGKWSHVVFTWGPDGYRLYKDGKLVAEKTAKPFPSQADHGAVGINVWDLTSGDFDGDIAQVRLSLASLEPGKGSGKGELAWASGLSFAKLVRPRLEWLAGPNESNLFVRERKPVLPLRVCNRFLEPLKVAAISVVAEDRYTGEKLPGVEIKLTEPVPPRGEKVVEVAPGIERAGVYTVTATGPLGSKAATTAAWVRGPQPEEPEGTAFFGNSSHDSVTPWAYQARREFGSRMARDLVHWHWVQKEPGEFTWKEDLREDPLHTVVGASLVGVDPGYMDRLRDAGAIDYTDVIAFHNYTWGRPPEPVIVKELARIIAWRDECAPGRPLWDNEWGYNATLDLRRHAQMTAAQLVITKAMGIQHSDFYTWRWADYHLFNGANFPTPAAIAYRTIAQRLTNALPAAAVSEGDNSVYAYLFNRRGVLTLVAWTSGERERTLDSVPANPDEASLYDLMGNPQPVPVENGLCRLTLTRSPLFLEGVSRNFLNAKRPLAPSPAGAPPPRHPSLWYSFHYPKGSEVVSLPRGATRPLWLTVYNDGDEPVAGRLTLRPHEKQLNLSTDRIEIELNPRSSLEVGFDVTAPRELQEGVYRVNITSAADGVSFGNMSIRCYVAEGETVFFRAATWEMAQNLVEAQGYGQGINIRWLEPGGFLTFRFDLTDAQSARLWAYMDSVSPAETDGGDFRVGASRDDESWDILLEGRGPWAWRDVDLTPYAGKVVWVRFEHPKTPIAKGQARVKAWRLVTVPDLSRRAK